MFHHVPEELGQNDYLVSSSVFQYDENPAMTCLTSITMTGYQANQNGGYMKEEFAPWEFHYSKNPDLQSLAIGEIDSFNVTALPGGVAPCTAEWVDLDGDGAPGLLIENSAKSLYYQRNLSDRNMGARFGPLCSLLNQPVLFSKGRYFEDIDRNGRLDLVCTNEHGVGLGYYERVSDGWANFKDFDQILNTKEPPENLARIDVVGNGLQDLVIFSKDRSEVRWHPSLAKEGFGKANSATMSDSVFTASSSNKSITTAFADMSGDGLVDVVRVSSGHISYWPNLGYGKFGTEIIMGNSPMLGEMGGLDHPRILFADVDGTGTADLLYFPEEGGVRLHYNLAGNAWSEARFISQSPRLDTLSTVALVDLFGNGTSCLCWTGPDLTGSSRHILHYLDLTDGHKPHMLKEFSNGTGHVWKIAYQPSTFFYRLDEAEGNPWKTRLPSPMQCVESTRAEDKTTGICMTTRFRYHDGMYDGVEREFAGFAAVEQWDAEKFDNSAATFTRPPVHKKTWYHSGCLGQDDRFTTPKGNPALGSLQIPAGITDIEGFRALRGRSLREEVYSDDNSAQQDLPYTVTQFNYSVHVVQSKNANTHPVLRISEKNTLTCNYERQVDHPRCSYSSIIETNDFGQPLKSITVAFGYRNSSLLDSRDKITQQEDIVTYDENTYTNAIDTIGIYRLPALASVKKWRLLGYKANAENSEQLVRSITLALAQCKQIDPAEADSNPQSCKVLLEEHRTYCRREDLSDYLALGELESFSSTSQTYSLVASQPSAWKDSLSKNCYILPDWFETSFGYVDLDKNQLQWRRSNRQIYSESSISELQDARSSFFSPICVIDPIGNQQKFEYDDKWLFQIKNTDAIGNVTNTAFSYVALQPIRIQDANDNRMEFAYDASGDKLGQAQMGKRGEDIGDSKQPEFSGA
ncbi:insecticide toxin TcdB middle/C-terminal region domain-containing protein [Trichoderma chlorosporum]